MDRSGKQSDQMIQNLSPFWPRIQGSENIGPNDVKFDPVFDQKVACKLKADQMIQNLGPPRPRIQGPENIGPNDVKFDPFLDQKVACKREADQIVRGEKW